MPSERERFWQRFEGDPLPYPLMRLLWIRRAIRDVPARARPRWLLNALTYRCEICFTCGCRVGRAVGDTWWWADDALWLRVIGRDHGIACPRCFTRIAEAKGIAIYWTPQEDSHDAT